VNYFRFSKSEIQAEERAHKAADNARERFEFREERAEREKREKAERLAKANAARQAAGTTLTNAAPADQTSAAVAAQESATLNPALDHEQATTPVGLDTHPVLDAGTKQAAIAAAVEQARAKRDLHNKTSH